MATKPNETYTWGENATREQVAAYEDTGWPSDIIPPKRTQFNWYQNLVGKWLGWAEDAVDEIVSTVLERWFTVVYPSGGANWEQTIPNENGLYEYRAGVPELHLERWLVTVTNGTAVAVRLRATTAAIPTHFELAFGVWDDNQGHWVREYTLNRSTSVSDITARNNTRYATPELLYQAGGQVTTGSNAYNGGWCEVTAGPDWIVLSEWGSVSVDSTGSHYIPTRATSVYSVQHSAVATPTSGLHSAGCFHSNNGISIGLYVSSDGSLTSGTVNFNYTVRIPRP